MLQNFFDHFGVIYARDHLDLSAAKLAFFNIDIA